jgi:hypothetical protein
MFDVSKNGLLTDDDTVALQRLLNAIADTDIVELEIFRDGLTLRLSRKMTIELAKSRQEKTVETSRSDVLIRSPTVGRAFRKEPIGDSVAAAAAGAFVFKGQSVAVVRAAGVVTPVLSSYDGRVAEILFTDGQAVSFNDPLIVLEAFDRTE